MARYFKRTFVHYGAKANRPGMRSLFPGRDHVVWNGQGVATPDHVFQFLRRLVGGADPFLSDGSPPLELFEDGGGEYERRAVGIILENGEVSPERGFDYFLGGDRLSDHQSAFLEIDDSVFFGFMVRNQEPSEDTPAPPALTEIFRDGADVGANVDLDAHTPQIGSGYGLISGLQTGTPLGVIRCVASTRSFVPLLVGTNNGAFYNLIRAAGSWVSSQWIECLMKNGDSSDDTNTLAVCFSDSTHLYALRFNESVSAIYKRNGSTTWVLLGSGSGILDYSLVALEHCGTNVRAYDDGVLIIDEIDADLSTGGPGIGMGSLSAQAPYNADDMQQQSLDCIKAGDGNYSSGWAVKDSFVEALNIDLEHHTPEVGDQWVRSLYQGASPYLEVKASTDRVMSKTTYINSGVIYTVEPSGGFTSADYIARLQGLELNAADNYYYLIVRWQDNNNFYCIEMTSAVTQAKIYQVVAGVWTQIGSGFTIVDEDILELECENGTLRAYVNGDLKTSGAGGGPSAAGKAGIGAGNLRVAAGDMTLGEWVDNFGVMYL